MSIRIDNNTFELKITPNKRKRDSTKDKPQSHHNKENNFVFNNFMEVKSIADLVKQRAAPSTAAQNNPFECVRKPPKKKTKHDIDESCFVNPALNINGPEKVFNPFEVKRMPESGQENHCFTNPGLNIRGAERDVANPFEVVRSGLPHSPAIADVQGIENPALDVQPTLAIAVPFTPTVGCRIDFNNIPLDALTPCSMLNNKLVFSPIKKSTDLTPKRSNLSIISEEAVDISKELESYQTELENSINEAKATKKRGKKHLMEMRRKSTFAKRLLGADTTGADDADHPAVATEESADNGEDEQPESRANGEHSCQEHNDGQSECPKSSTPKTPNENCIAKYPMERSVGENPDFVYEEIDEISQRNNATAQNRQEIVEARAREAANHTPQAIVDAAPSPVPEDNFKNPAPFVRTYRRDLRKPIVSAGAKTEEAKAADAGDRPKEHHEMFGSIRSSIRKSIRKLINTGGGSDGGKKTKSSENVSAKDEATTPTSSSASSILSSIRHSMRRKQPIKQPLATSTPCESLNDISILDNCKPRAVFRDTAFAGAENAFATGGGHKDAFGGGMFAGRTTTIRSSLRKSSRHVIKSMFKKNIEDYDLEK